MGDFEAKTSADPERVAVVLAGECDLSVRGELTALLLDAVSSRQVVAVDLAGVTFMDSSGLHALMTAHQTAQKAGRRLYVSGAVGVVAALLDITGVRALLSPAASDHDPAGAAAAGDVHG